MAISLEKFALAGKSCLVSSKNFSPRLRPASGSRPRGLQVDAKAVASPHKYQVDNEVTHSLTAERLDVIQSLDSFAERDLSPLLKTTESNWQPQDFLPDPEKDSFLDEVADLRARAAGISDDHLVCLVGDMITEEALPTYMNMLNTLDGVRDETGASDTAWARWTRMWTAEENRHGDLLNKYLWLTGRVNMKAVETTIQNLIGSGMNPKTENNPYLGFVYTSFQERATRISHANTARYSIREGDKNLGVICGKISADEGRHEVAYQLIVEKLFERDEEGAMLAYADMMRKQIVMPAHMMNDNSHATSSSKSGNSLLFDDFSSVAERLEIYTASDYANIMDHLNKRWKVGDRMLSGEAAEAQEYVMKLPTRVRRIAERTSARKKKMQNSENGKSTAKFSWISNREVTLL
mmetsp:Transcript_11923/g.16158  ORF Transcript_11923/g.16158 Transcript_11923/m.16158 type:complete len:408 (-) Transcript_11923:384-1607(-)|eukprot:CAMPEP_0196581374 /NCGR_PEP_ID=MMETSP1081-20130531/33851_1 /TAXON_ID=36882 /ORGANISM="Pyramimonas amylifera, Strain CCMP720" /LENGTH=407 /DNA_ID=CAMNT_0041901581 /DNA_START=97 /DNA_END=1320 /DNA_ORIENTATION=-